MEAQHLIVLDRLAAIMGVEPSYVDVMGTEHTASPLAKKAILEALGLAVGSLGDACQTLRQQRQIYCAHQLPAVSVLRRNQQPFAVDVMLFVQPTDGTLPWRLTLEDGSTRQGVGTLMPSTESEQTAILQAALAAPLPDEDPHGSREMPQCLAFHLPSDLPDGYHRLEITPAPGDDRVQSGMLIIAPGRSWLPTAMEHGEQRVWGIGAQIYSLRSQRNWGMGDLGDLNTLCKTAGLAGAAVVGINPIHALFLPKPEDASPYSPNSRLFLNPLYISIEDVPEYETCADAKGRMADPSLSQDLAQARAADHVNYTSVSRTKMAILPILFAAFNALPDHDTRKKAFTDFVSSGGDRLARFAIFQALQDHHGMLPWPQWPSEFHDPNGAAVSVFAEHNAEAIRFHLWLQFECDRQLAAAAQTLKNHGGHLGLYRDLAVGASPDGADTWMDAQAYVLGARFGAPPDALGPMGQDWGLPPFNPRTLEALGYAPFIDMVRANMRHAGALRIDHAMALQHLFWIPPGLTAKDGLYITYPIDALVAILALESHRAECLVIGEDLGTVPPEFRLRMAEENILSYRLLYFERYETGLFKRPDTYPALALSTPTSHDLATIAGNWRGWDVAMRHQLGIAGPDGDLVADQQARAEDRDVLRAALVDQGLIPADFPINQTIGHTDLVALVNACHRFLARAPSLLMLANLDDLALEVTQVNVPGTVCEYPNWRRRLALSLDDIANNAEFTNALNAINQER
jgi:4-alpha-glucanotransferase